jgi:UDP-N-acetylmuramate dehydrogenase
VIFKLSKKPIHSITYEPLRTHFVDKIPNLSEIRNKVLQIRRSKGMVYDPRDTNTHSTGSFFINPYIKKERLDELLKDYPNLPYWFVEGDLYKVSAAWLIEESGFKKGYKHKSAALSDKHALAIVNKGKATAQDIFDFSALLKQEVYKKFSIELVREAVIVGDFN